MGKYSNDLGGLCGKEQFHVFFFKKSQPIAILSLLSSSACIKSIYNSLKLSTFVKSVSSAVYLGDLIPTKSYVHKMT